MVLICPIILRSWWHCQVSGTLGASTGTLFVFDATPYHSQKLGLCTRYSFYLNISWRRWKWWVGNPCHRSRFSPRAKISVLIRVKGNKTLRHLHKISKKFCWLRSHSFCSYHSSPPQQISSGHWYDVHKRSIHAYHMFSTRYSCEKYGTLVHFGQRRGESCCQVTVTRS